jgi:hypothetical protein
MVAAVVTVIVRSGGGRTCCGSIVCAPMNSPVNACNAAGCQRPAETGVSFVNGDNDGPRR